MSDLKSCHFCGGEARLSRDGYSLELRVMCDECGARTEDFETDKEAIAAWNRRASPPSPAPDGSQIDALKAAVEGECHGLAISDEQARAILSYVLGATPPAPAPEGWRKLLLSAKILYANAEGCVVNHHGRDRKVFGLPGWLADCKRDIDHAEALYRAMISAAPAAPTEARDE